MQSGLFSEQEIGRLNRHKSKPNGIVLHTFNQYDILTAIDGWDYKHRRVGRSVEWLLKIRRRFFLA